MLRPLIAIMYLDRDTYIVYIDRANKRLCYIYLYCVITVLYYGRVMDRINHEQNAVIRDVQ